jgi:hypothetical protein
VWRRPKSPAPTQIRMETTLSSGRSCNASCRQAATRRS